MVSLENLQDMADKSCRTVQHPAMRVVCPHCQAAYQLEGVDEGTILVCHRCDTEFGFGQPPEDAETFTGIYPENSEDKYTLPLFTADLTGEGSRLDEDVVLPSEDIPDITETENTEPGPETAWIASNPSTDEADRIVPAETLSSDQKEASPDTEENNKEATEPEASVEAIPEDEDTPLLPPPRARVRIMPWLLTVILLIAVTGFWFKHDAWLDDPWLRSVLINVGLPVEVRDKDWYIQPESIHAQWIKRDNGSQVLVIEGRVKNLLQCELVPPAIRFSIFAKDDPEHLLLERELLISQPPLMVAIRHAPYIVQPEDRVPVTALGDRGFMLVLEGLPKNAGDFTLTALSRGAI